MIASLFNVWVALSMFIIMLVGYFFLTSKYKSRVTQGVLLTVGAVGVIVICCGFIFFLYPHNPNPDSKNDIEYVWLNPDPKTSKENIEYLWLIVYSNIGQAFGILNTIFSGLAFIGVYLTFKTQREQLEEQKKQAAQQNSHLEEQLRVQKSDSLVRILHENFSELKKLGGEYSNDIKTIESDIHRGDKYNKNIINNINELGLCALSTTPLHHRQEYLRVLGYLSLLETSLQYYVDNKYLFNIFETIFVVWQRSLSIEQLHIVFYFAFYDLDWNETETNLGKLLEKTGLVQHFKERVVTDKTNFFIPFDMKWFEKRESKLNEQQV